MKKHFLLAIAAAFSLSATAQAQSLRSEGLPGIYISQSAEGSKLRSDEQYHVTVSCEDTGQSAQEYLKRTNRFGRFTERTPTIHARHVSHFAMASDTRIRRFTTNAAVSQVVTNPNTTWSEIFLLSEAASSTTFSGGCLDSFYITGQDAYYIAGFAGFDTSGTSTASLSAFLTFVTTLKSVVENVSLADVAASDSSDALVDASAIVDAYKTYETALTRNRADFVTKPLREGSQAIETGFTKIRFDVVRHDSFLFADGIPFRRDVKNLLAAAVPATAVSQEFSNNLKKSEKSLFTLDDPYESIASECDGIVGALIDHGFYSDIDRAYLLAAFLKRQRAKPLQRVMCFHAADLSHVMLDNDRFLQLLAHRSKGEGRNAVFYANDHRRAAAIFGWDGLF